VNEQRLGASETLTGIRRRRHKVEIWVPGLVVSTKTKVLAAAHTEVLLSAGRHEHSVNNAIHVDAPERSQVVFLEAALQPLHLAFVDPPDETIVQRRLCRSDEYWLGSDFN
jgi:hypothetical protein